mmetsp:Transcript_7264/g.26753  ORF Transcript_7264/g.26753 Transcript_7264/m.26753 type:complete len:210 (-) Transcript_7264:1549-2178(-)
MRAPLRYYEDIVGVRRVCQWLAQIHAPVVVIKYELVLISSRIESHIHDKAPGVRTPLHVYRSPAVERPSQLQSTAHAQSERKLHGTHHLTTLCTCTLSPSYGHTNCTTGESPPGLFICSIGLAAAGASAVSSFVTCPVRTFCMNCSGSSSVAGTCVASSSSTTVSAACMSATAADSTAISSLSTASPSVASFTSAPTAILSASPTEAGS